MREQVEARLTELRGELKVGEERLRELDAEQGRLRETLLRIDGAMLALAELLQREDADSGAKEAAATSAAQVSDATAQAVRSRPPAPGASG